MAKLAFAARDALRRYIGGNTDLSNALDRQIDSFNNFVLDSCMVGYYLMYDRTSTQL